MNKIYAEGTKHKAETEGLRKENAELKTLVKHVQHQISNQIELIISIQEVIRNKNGQERVVNKKPKQKEIEVQSKGSSRK